MTRHGACSVDERDVTRENHEILNQPSDEFSSYRHGKLVDDAKSRRYDEDEVVEKNNDEVAKPFDLSVVAEKIKICDSWKAIEMSFSFFVTSQKSNLPLT